MFGGSVPKRRSGPLEERLRRAVAEFTKPRGAAVRFAKLIDRPPSWLTEYKQGENHASLDTSVALMRAIGWRLEDVLSPEPLDPDALTLLAQIQGLEPEPRALILEMVTRASGGDALVVVATPQSRERRSTDRLRATRRVADRQRAPSR